MGLTPGCKLVLVSGGAGTGKTSLLSEWARQTELPVLWLSLSSDDNDFPQWVQYLVVALQSIDPNAGKSALEILRSPTIQPLRILWSNLVKDILEIGKPFVLILDDYHSISNQDIHDAVLFLLNQLPENVHLIISSRALLPIPLARLKMMGEVIELGHGDLSFTRDEIAKFIKQTTSITLQESELDILQTKTEGWAAGLQISTLGMQNTGDVHGLIASFSGNAQLMTQYLMQEVVDHLPGDTRSFLYGTSALDQFCASLCDMVVGKTGSDVMLEQLKKQNLFLVPLDDQGIWYRYHHIFSDLLREQFKVQDPDGYLQAIRMASLWYVQTNMPAEAIKYAFWTGDDALAADLVEKFSDEMMANSELGIVRKWFDHLPEQIVQSRPSLCLLEAKVSLLLGQLVKMDQRLTQAELLLTLDDSSPDHRKLMGFMCVMRASQARLKNEIVKSMELAQQALDLLPEDDPYYAPALVILGNALVQNGRIGDAIESYEKAARIFNLIQAPYQTIVASSELAYAHFLAGRLNRSEDICRDILYRFQGRYSVTAKVFICLGQILYERNRIIEAGEYFRIAIEKGKLEGNIRLVVEASIYLGRTECWYKGPGHIDDCYKESIQLINQHGISGYTELIEYYRVRSWIRYGNLDAAMEWAGRQNLQQDDPNRNTADIKKITLAHLHLAIGKPELALKELSKIDQAARNAGRLGNQVEIGILQAVALMEIGNFEDARMSLIRTLKIAESQGFLRLFVEKVDVLDGLYNEILQSATSNPGDPAYPSVEFVSSILKEKASHSMQGQHMIKETANSSPTNHLTSREVEMLRLLALGYTNTELAELLSISIHTVKTHLRSIFGKLLVSNRTQAVAKARNLKIL